MCNSSVPVFHAQLTVLVVFLSRYHGKFEHDAPQLPLQSSHRNSSWTALQLRVPFDQWQAPQAVGPQSYQMRQTYLLPA